MILVALLLLSANPVSGSYLSVEDRVDRIEIWHAFSPKGYHYCDYIIFWEIRDLPEPHWRVVDWRMIQAERNARERKGERLERELEGKPPPLTRYRKVPPHPTRQNGYWVSEWWDRRSGCYRRVRALRFNESWTIGRMKISENLTVLSHRGIVLTKRDWRGLSNPRGSRP